MRNREEENILEVRNYNARNSRVTVVIKTDSKLLDEEVVVKITDEYFIIKRAGLDDRNTRRFTKEFHLYHLTVQKEIEVGFYELEDQDEDSLFFRLN